MKRKTIENILQMKHKEPIAMLTAYDYPTAKIVDSAGVDIILVGDSLGNVIHGFETTLPVSLEMMCLHGAAVVRGTTQALVVIDMPFGSYQSSSAQACDSAVEILKYTHAQAVKLEGGAAMEKTIAHLVSVGIPVMGHVGVTPQSVHQLSGYRKRGKSDQEANGILKDARAVANAGAFCVVLEGVDENLASEITSQLTIPTIGIAAGKSCDGQVLVLHDLLGLSPDPAPKFVEPTGEIHSIMREGILKFIQRTKK